jgi:hypothetical protein
MRRHAFSLIVTLLLCLPFVLGSSVAIDPIYQVGGSTTNNITVTINDSRHGVDTGTTQVDIQPNASSSVPTNLQRFTGGNNEIGNIDVLAAVQAANDGTLIGGQSVGNLDVLGVVQYANTNNDNS